MKRHEQADEAGDFMLIEGDVRDALRSLEAESVDCVVTSPPYWSLRDYGLEPSMWGGDQACEHEWGDESFTVIQAANLNKDLNERMGRSPGTLRKQENGRPERVSEGQFCRRCGAWRGQLGLEPSPELFVAHLVEVFREVRRVLAPHGVCWLNLGDSYMRDQRDTDGLKIKDLCMIPASAALALRADGWWLRSETVWNKPNAMTSSVKDRPSCAHEMVYLLAKSASYYYDRYAVREPVVPDGRKQTTIRGTDKSHDNYASREGGERWPEVDRAVRSVWTIASQPFSASWLGFDDDDHFATFPEKLAERCVELGTPREVCVECGRPRQRIVERGELVGNDRGGNYQGRDVTDKVNRMEYPAESEVEYRPGMAFEVRTVGWSECGCSRGLEPDDLELVLTPTGERAEGVEDPSLETGRAGRNRPRNEGEGTRPITRYEQRKYAEQLRYLKANFEVFKEMQRAAGREAMAHYMRTDRAGARPIPPDLLEEWITDWNLLEPVELPAAKPGTFRRGVVLDPFAGSGTVAVAARRGGRRSIGCEAHPRYAEIALARAAAWWKKPVAPRRDTDDSQLSLV